LSRSTYFFAVWRSSSALTFWALDDFLAVVQAETANLEAGGLPGPGGKTLSAPVVAALEPVLAPLQLLVRDGLAADPRGHLAEAPQGLVHLLRRRPDVEGQKSGMAGLPEEGAHRIAEALLFPEDPEQGPALAGEDLLEQLEPRRGLVLLARHRKHGQQMGLFAAGQAEVQFLLIRPGRVGKFRLLLFRA
jgi:hypothetical protein